MEGEFEKVFEFEVFDLDEEVPVLSLIGMQKWYTEWVRYSPTLEQAGWIHRMVVVRYFLTRI